MSTGADDQRLIERLLDRVPGTSPSVLVVVAHPDDEVLGCGCLLAQLPFVRVIHVTDGAPLDGTDAAHHGFATPQDYATARWREALDALSLAGIAADHVATLSIADQQVSKHLVPVVHMLSRSFAKTEIVLTHAYEGGHSDHDAVAFAAHAAQRLATPAPLLVEMPFYHAKPDGWTRQTFLPSEAVVVEHVMALNAGQRALKRRMIAAFRSQAETLAAFDLDAERFRLAPAHDFTRRPHGGELLYERHGWNLDWPSWVVRVRQAQADLRMDDWA